jgi:5,10-methylenetetrahydromethanopterin reductase
VGTHLGSIGVVLPRDLPAAQVPEFARRADELGFDELWVVEDLGFRGGIAQTAVALAATERIRVGIGLLPTGARNVAFAAMEIASLAELFPGRLDVGIGHGMPSWMRSVGAWPASPLTLLHDYVETLRALLQGRTVSAAGPYVQLDGVTLETRPGMVPDLLVGVRGPKSLAVSGQVADGTVLAEPVSPEYARAALAQVETGQAGRDAADPRRAEPSPHRLVAYNVAAVDDDGVSAIAAARTGLEWIGEPDWRPHILPLPFADEFAALRADCADGAEFASRLPEAWVRRLAVTGTPEEARASLAELTAAGVTSNVLILPGPDPLQALTSAAAILEPR